jgi:epoxyqueuosine reductase
VRSAQALPDDSPFAPREAVAGKDARPLACAILAVDVEAYRAAHRGSPMRRAKLPAMQCDSAVVLGNVGTAEDVPVLQQALSDPGLLMREQCASTPRGRSRRSGR